jgi:hypothetical protein
MDSEIRKTKVTKNYYINHLHPCEIIELTSSRLIDQFASFLLVLECQTMLFRKTKTPLVAMLKIHTQQIRQESAVGLLYPAFAI